MTQLRSPRLLLLLHCANARYALRFFTALACSWQCRNDRPGAPFCLTQTVPSACAGMAAGASGTRAQPSLHQQPAPRTRSRQPSSVRTRAPEPPSMLVTGHTAERKEEKKTISEAARLAPRLLQPMPQAACVRALSASDYFWGTPGVAARIPSCMPCPAHAHLNLKPQIPAFLSLASLTPFAALQGWLGALVLCASEGKSTPVHTRKRRVGHTNGGGRPS